MRIVIAGVLVAALCVGVPATSTADRWEWRDEGRVRRGAIESVTYRSSHPGETIIKITLEHPLDEYRMTSRDGFVIDVDRTGDGRGDTFIVLAVRDGYLEHYAHVFYRGHQGSSFGGTAVEQKGPRSIVVTFSPEETTYGPGSPESYLFTVYSIFHGASACGKHCADVVPNRGRLIFDFWDPIAYLSAPKISVYPGEPRVKVGWGGVDWGFAGFKNRTLRVQKNGDRRWQLLARRREGSSTYRLTPKEGDVVVFKTVTRDGIGGSARKFVKTAVPFDDTSTALGASFLGTWLPFRDEDAYRGTHQTAISEAATFTFSGKGRHYCIVYEPATGIARMTGGGRTKLVDQSAWFVGTYWDCLRFKKTLNREVVVSVEEDEINIDGYWIGDLSRFRPAKAQRGSARSVRDGRANDSESRRVSPDEWKIVRPALDR